jgi:hypothetical protein
VESVYGMSGLYEVFFGTSCCREETVPSSAQTPPSMAPRRSTNHHSTAILAARTSRLHGTRKKLKGAEILLELLGNAILASVSQNLPRVQESWADLSS